MTASFQHRNALKSHGCKLASWRRRKQVFKDQVVVFVGKRPSKLLKPPLNEPGHKVSWSVSRLDRSLLQSCEHHHDITVHTIAHLKSQRHLFFLHKRVQERKAFLGKHVETRTLKDSPVFTVILIQSVGVLLTFRWSHNRLRLFQSKVTFLPFLSLYSNKHTFVVTQAPPVTLGSPFRLY